MTEAQQNNQAVSNTAEVATEQSTDPKQQASLQDVEKKYFPPASVSEGSDYINAVVEICTRENVEPIFNFDTEKDFPENYGLSVIPLTKRVAERGNMTYGIVVAAIPSVDALMSEEGGINYITKLVTDSLLKQASAAAKPKEDGALISIPFTIEQFVTTSRTSGLAAFNTCASDYVKALKQKGLKFMSKVLLRQVLSSAAFAEQQFPRLSQDNWKLVLDSMIAHVAKDGMEAGVLAHWIATRDNVEIDETEVDLSGLDDLMTKEDKPAVVAATTADVTAQA